MMNGFERLFTLYVTVFIGWIIFLILVFYLKIKFFKWLYKSKQQQVKTKHEVRKTTTQPKETKSLPVTDPEYERAKNVFNCAMKNGQLCRQDIIELKGLINTSLGNHQKKYSSYYFANDANEIYVKLKDGNLNMLDYQRIVDFLISRATTK